MLSDHLLGLFFSDEQNFIYDHLVELNCISPSYREQLKVLAFRFLGPLFFSAASKSKRSWSFELIECGLILDPIKPKIGNFFQSLFVVNSSIFSQNALTNLCAVCASIYTENIDIIQEKMQTYIHPSILQGKLVGEYNQGIKFNLGEYFENEVRRGAINLKDTLGQARKAYGHPEDLEYYVVGIIERKGNLYEKTTTLFTFDQDDPLRLQIKKFIPSFYICAILPDYYEHRMIETLLIFKRDQVIPTLNKIQLTGPYGKAIYIEEYISDGEEIHSFGLILISENEYTQNIQKLSSYKRKLREILLNQDENERKRTLAMLNPSINPFKEWKANTSEELHLIQNLLDETELSEETK